MSDQSNASAAEVQSKLQHLNCLLLDMLLPAEKVAAICREIDFAFRARVYTPMVTVWMFITQVLSADHSCQQAVARLNGWRTAQGLSHCRSETTSYCKARKRLPEALFERLLAWTALQCFTGAMQALEEFAATLRLGSERRSMQWDNLLTTIHELKVGNRPNRNEPHKIKRRPKSYKFLQTPRNPNRNAYTTAA